MRLETIICLSIITIVVLVVVVYYLRVISCGYWFCELSNDFFEIIRIIKFINENDRESNTIHVISGNYIRVVYEPGNYRTIFFELDYIIIKIQSFYQVIENKEGFFRYEDWNKIQKIEKEFREKINRIKYQEWIHGYRRV